MPLDQSAAALKRAVGRRVAQARCGTLRHTRCALTRLRHCLFAIAFFPQFGELCLGLEVGVTQRFRELVEGGQRC